MERNDLRCAISMLQREDFSLIWFLTLLPSNLSDYSTKYILILSIFH
jgi:hypothetical protein